MDYQKIKRIIKKLGFIEKSTNFYEIDINNYIMHININAENEQIIYSNIDYGDKIKV